MNPRGRCVNAQVLRLITLKMLAFLLGGLFACGPARAQSPDRDQVVQAMQRATDYYANHVALRGGYVYFYSLDLQRRLGEGVASPTQVWVQPPGTPAVGLAYLAAYRATSDAHYLEAARAAAGALVHGQLQSGGWQNLVDFDPRSKSAGKYRSGQGNPTGRNYSTLDDGITQTALRFLIRLDEAEKGQNSSVRDTVKVALEALLVAQFPIGAFPQVWDGPVKAMEPQHALYPNYDWKTENRIKDYWNLYTLNDGLAGSVAELLITASEVYQDPRYDQALRKLGDFLIAAQMPEPQPAWAQQYDYQMRPVWARKFEPPAIAGRESEDAIATLLRIFEVTGERKYLAPIPAALAYLKASQLSDGQLARYYELQTNRPLYMNQRYELTYDDRNVPDHYGWKTPNHLAELEARTQRAMSGQSHNSSNRVTAKQVANILASLDAQGRWVNHYDGERLIGQAKFKPGDAYLSSEQFAENLTALATFLEQP